MKRSLACTIIAIASCTDGGSHVNPPTIVHDDHFVVAEDSMGPTVTDIVANDVGEKSYKMISVIAEPLHGKWNGTGAAYVYVPDPGYHGPDQFTYTDYSHESSTVATVTIDVTSDGIPYEESMQLDTTPGADVAVGDLTGDGKPDIVVANTHASSIVILENTTQAPLAFTAKRYQFEGGHTPTSVKLADLDNDGRLDIVIASGTDGVVLLHNRRTSPLEFDAPVYLPSGDTYDVAVADLNGDGLPDIASLDHNTDVMIVRINASSGAGNIGFGIPYRFTTPKGPIRIETGDADGAGGIDLIVVAYTAGALSLFVNAMAVGDQVPAFASRVDRATGTRPSNVFLADLDGDSHTEIGVLDSQLWIYANRSPGGGASDFNAARVLDVPYGAYVAAPLDLDGHGPIDLMIGTSSAYNFGILLNKSSTTDGFAFDPKAQAIGAPDKHARAVLGDTRAIVSADLDGVPPSEIVVMTSAGTQVLFER